LKIKRKNLSHLLGPEADAKNFAGDYKIKYKNEEDLRKAFESLPKLYQAKDEAIFKILEQIDVISTYLEHSNLCYILFSNRFTY